MKININGLLSISGSLVVDFLIIVTPILGVCNYFMIFPYIVIQKVWDYPLCTLRGHRLKFLNDYVFLSLKVV